MASSPSAEALHTIQQAEACLLLNRPGEGLKHVQTFAHTLATRDAASLLPPDARLALACLHIQLQSRLSPEASQLRTSLSALYRDLGEWPVAVWLTAFSALVDSGADKEAHTLAHDYLRAAGAHLETDSQAVVLRAEAARIVLSGGHTADVDRWLAAAPAHPHARTVAQRDLRPAGDAPPSDSPVDTRPSAPPPPSALPAGVPPRPKAAASSSSRGPRASSLRTRRVAAQLLALALWLLGVAGVAKWLVRQPAWNSRLASLLAFFGANSVRSYLA